MTYYKVIDLQGCSFMSYTEQEPETGNELRSHFWGIYQDQMQTDEPMQYKNFTMDFIKDLWEVDFEKV